MLHAHQQAGNECTRAGAWGCSFLCRRSCGICPIKDLARLQAAFLTRLHCGTLSKWPMCLSCRMPHLSPITSCSAPVTGLSRACRAIIGWSCHGLVKSSCSSRSWRAQTTSGSVSASFPSVCQTSARWGRSQGKAWLDCHVSCGAGLTPGGGSGRPATSQAHNACAPATANPCTS